METIHLIPILASFSATKSTTTRPNPSKIRSGHKLHQLLSPRMPETKLGRMELELTGIFPRPVKRIPHDRNTQALGMRRMNPQLMSPSRDRSEGNSGPPIFDPDFLPMRNPDLSMNFIVNLDRTIIDIETEG